jgi:proteasome lid subunit RPN8/RPN11
MLILPRKHSDAMIAHAKAALPNEGCGLFAGTIVDHTKTVKAVYCLTNIDKSPEHFSMTPEEQFSAIADIRKQGLTLLGNFHSHPATPARPSQEDIRLAFDPALSYIIISLEGQDSGTLPVLKSFAVHEGTATEETVRV